MKKYEGIGDIFIILGDFEYHSGNEQVCEVIHTFNIILNRKQKHIFTDGFYDFTQVNQSYGFNLDHKMIYMVVLRPIVTSLIPQQE